MGGVSVEADAANHFRRVLCHGKLLFGRRVGMTVRAHMAAVSVDALAEYEIGRDVRLEGQSFVKWNVGRWLASRTYKLASWEVPVARRWPQWRAASLRLRPWQRRRVFRQTPLIRGSGSRAGAGKAASNRCPA